MKRRKPLNGMNERQDDISCPITYLTFSRITSLFKGNTQEIPREFIIHSCVYFLAIFQIVTPANISLFEISNDNMSFEISFL